MMASILLVIDIQDALSLSNDISVTDNIRAINALISTYNPQDVYYIRHLEDGSEFDPNQKTSQLHLELNLVNNQIIHKYHHSAFYQTPLNVTLKEKNIETIDICGYQIEYCVDATIKTGHYLGYHVRIHQDHIHTFSNHHLTKEQIKTHYLNQFKLYGKLI
jgi:nicotinamidase-related amidase